MNKEVAKGKWHQLSGSIQEKYGMSKEEAQLAFDALSQPII